MCYSFTDKMDHKKNIFASEKNEANQQPYMGDIEKQGGGSAKKRPAQEMLQHSLTKAPKMSVDKGVATEQLDHVSDPRDEKIAKLIAKLNKSKAGTSELEDELEEVRDEMCEYRCRVHELEAREKKRIEKENLVETSMHATMKLAMKNAEAERRVKKAKDDKEMREKVKLDKEDYAAKHDARSKKKLDEAAAKAQKSDKLLQERLNKANETHKQEIKALKEEQKEALKDLRPEHSSAVKEKAKELKAKDKEITDLQKEVKGMKAVMAENKKLQGEAKAREAKNAGLRDYIKKEQETWETTKAEWKTKEEQYNSKLEHENSRWQLQNTNAIEANTRSILQQRANFALRADRNAKDSRIRELEEELQAAREQNQDSNILVLQQQANLALKADLDANGNHIGEPENEPQAAQEQGQSSNVKTYFQRSIAMNETATADGGENGEASTTEQTSAATPLATDNVSNDVVEANGGSEGAE